MNKSLFKYYPAYMLGILILRTKSPDKAARWITKKLREEKLFPPQVIGGIVDVLSVTKPDYYIATILDILEREYPVFIPLAQDVEMRTLSLEVQEAYLKKDYSKVLKNIEKYETEYGEHNETRLMKAELLIAEDFGKNEHKITALMAKVEEEANKDKEKEKGGNKNA